MATSCLNCGTALVSGQSRMGQFLECPSCNSRLVGFHLLRHLLPRETADHLWIQGRENAEAGLRPCPLCKHGMAGTSLPGDPIVLDLCTRCHMVWFDSQEFEAEPWNAPTTSPIDRLNLQERKQLAAEIINFQKEMAPGEDFYGPPQNAKELVQAVLRLPIEGNNPLSRIPVATWATAFLILLVSLCTFWDIEAAALRFGFIPSDAFRMGALTWITSFFIHGGFFHLVGNLYFLLVFGDNVEDCLGAGRFLILLVSATLVGNLVSLIVSSGDSQIVPHIGASGGISGLLSFYALQFPDVRIGFLFFFRILRLPAVFLLVLWILMQVLGAMIQSADITMVDYGAHLGGTATGVLFWLFWRKRGGKAEPAVIQPVRSSTRPRGL